MSYPKWVQVEGQPGTTAWCEEDEKKYYSAFNVGVAEKRNDSVRVATKAPSAIHAVRGRPIKTKDW
ncbi:MAG: hypothetical protein M0R74_11345 [Dehalococcoidia bacterium]|jgi:hypothetical protein|nr:hypothetical protein [Dehalococcoidia bacterium]